MVKPY